MSEMRACHKHDTFYWIVCETCSFERLLAFAKRVLPPEAWVK